MAASPVAVDSGSVHSQEKWNSQDTQATDIIPNGSSSDPANGGGGPHSDDHANTKPTGEGVNLSRNSSTAPDAVSVAGSKQDASQRGEKQIKVLVESYFQCINYDPCLSLRALAHTQSRSTCLIVSVPTVLVGVLS